MKKMSAIELGILWNIEEYYKKGINEGKDSKAIKIRLIELIDNVDLRCKEISNNKIKVNKKLELLT